MEWNREFRDRYCVYGNLTYDQSGPRNQWEKETGYWENKLTVWRKRKLGPYLVPCSKVDCGCIQQLKVKDKAIKLNYDNAGDLGPQGIGLLK